LSVTFNVKQRIGFFFMMLFLILLTIAGFFMGIYSWKEYLQFPKSITYSGGDTFALLSFLMMIPFTLLSIDPIFKGIRSPLEKAKKLTKWLVYCFFIIIIVPILVSLFYLNTIENKGYLACRGTPIGFTPGAATKYVLDLSLCKKNK